VHFQIPTRFRNRDLKFILIQKLIFLTYF
jgi:hypothetical protein